MQKLAGKTFYINGASGGIGTAICKHLASNGARLILAGRSQERLEKVLAELPTLSSGPSHIILAYSPSDEAAVKSSFESIFKQSITLDGLVNNVGFMKATPMAMVNGAGLREAFDINFYSHFFHAQMAARLMSRKKNGSILNISSVIGTRGFQNQTVYSATKSAIIGMTKSMAKEFAKDNLRVNAVAPGFIETALTDQLPAEARQQTLSQIGLGRFGKPEDVAKLVSFLLSDDSAYITGQVIELDGGMQL